MSDCVGLGQDTCESNGNLIVIVASGCVG